MRKLILLAVVFATILTTSCSKDDNVDFTNPENISGTTWKCTSGTDWDEDHEYILMIFTSTTTVEGWSKEPNEEEELDWSGSFTISDDQISLSSNAVDIIITGIIDDENMTLTMAGGTYIFSEQ